MIRYVVIRPLQQHTPQIYSTLRILFSAMDILAAVQKKEPMP